MVAIDDIGLGPHHTQRAAPAARAARADELAGQTRLACASWPVWGVTATVTVTDPRLLRAAQRLAMQQIAATEAVANRFRRNAEIHRLYRAGGRAITVSPLLADLVSAALIMAERTGGDVDPTVSAAMNAWAATGLVRHPLLPVCTTRTSGVRPAPGWEQVHLRGRRLQVPAGTTLDLSAPAKAMAVDRAAARVADRLGTGVLVELGGDAACAGPAPAGGWTATVHGRDGALQCLVTLPAGAALVTSHGSPRVHVDVENLRQGRTPGVHLIDPHTGRPPAPVWQQVSAIGFSCLEATACTTAALVRGTSARSWLTELWVPSRLVTLDGDVITAGSWESHEIARSASTSTDSPVPGPRLAKP